VRDNATMTVSTECLQAPGGGGIRSIDRSRWNRRGYKDLIVQSFCGRVAPTSEPQLLAGSPMGMVVQLNGKGDGYFISKTQLRPA
jgi:hypothetical protein